MIIACNSCNKKFDIDQNLIPAKGRLLQCNSCDHKWFFKSKIAVKTIESSVNKNMEVFDNNKFQENNSKKTDNKTNIHNKITLPTKETINKAEINKIKNKQKNNLLSLTIVFIISFIALIMIADTFINPLGKIVPNLEFLLYNLYESIKDIRLFFNDLVK